jgi:hypothetical protein
MGALAIALQIVTASAALAHSLTVTASAVCNGSTGVINYTATAWDTTSVFAQNSRIDILVNGVVVATGAFVLPTNSFSGSVLAPTGTSATVSAVAVNNWGDGYPGGQSASTTVALSTDCSQVGTGRFTGGGSQISVGGVRITKGLTIHCDLLLSNNLEVNWNGHQFHMEDHITTVQCSDDPNITQAPPAAPLDTLVGIGIGRYDNVDGYTIRFTLIDAGEPGSSDSAALLIYETANPANVVLNLPLTHLDGGNLQAHYDQPHKK